MKPTSIVKKDPDAQSMKGSKVKLTETGIGQVLIDSVLGRDLVMVNAVAGDAPDECELKVFAVNGRDSEMEELDSMTVSAGLFMEDEEDRSFDILNNEDNSRDYEASARNKQSEWASAVIIRMENLPIFHRSIE